MCLDFNWKGYCDNFDKVQKLAGHFGFSPATRKGIMSMVDKKENKDDFADFERQGYLHPTL